MISVKHFPRRVDKRSASTGPDAMPGDWVDAARPGFRCHPRPRAARLIHPTMLIVYRTPGIIGYGMSLSGNAPNSLAKHDLKSIPHKPCVATASGMLMGAECHEVLASPIDTFRFKKILKS